MSKNRTLADFISTSSVSAEEIANGAVTVVKLANTTSSNGTSLIQMSGHSTALNITPSGRIGINTSDPLVPLHIENEGMRIARNSGDAYIQLTQQGSTDVSLYGGPNGFRVFHGASESMRIDSNGRVGIGTASPTEQIHIEGSSSAGLRIKSTGSDSNLLLQSNDGALSSIFFGDVSDQSRGLIRYDNATENMFFSVNNMQEAMRIDSSGNLLVGKTVVNTFNEGLVVTKNDGTNITSNSSTVLDLNRRTTDGAIIALRKDNALVGQIGNATDFWIASADGTGLRFTNSQVLPCDENGNLQNTSRDLGATGSKFNNLWLSGTSYSNFVQLASSGSAVFFENSDYLIQGSATNGYLRFLTNNSEALRIDSSGRVNIGGIQSSSGSKLAVISDSVVTSGSSVTSEGILLVPSANLTTSQYTPWISWTGYAASSATNRARAAIGAVSTNGASALDLVFATRNAADGSEATSADEKVRIRSGGNITVGLDHVANTAVEKAFSSSHQSANRGSSLRFGLSDGSFGGMIVRNVQGSNSSFNSQYVEFHSHNGGVSAGERMRLDYSGNFIIGATSVSGPDGGNDIGLVLANNGRFYTCTNPGGNVFEFYALGTGSARGTINITSSGVTFNNNSDYRLKENVADLTGATDRLKQLRPVTFNYIDDVEDTLIEGFIAHEVQEIVPQAITGTKDAVNEDGREIYQGIDQSRLVPLLVATIQELEARIAALESN